MELTQLCNIVKTFNYERDVQEKIEAFHQIKRERRSPRYFTVCINDNEEIAVVSRFLHSDSEGLTRIFACRRLPDSFFYNGTLRSNRIEPKIHSFFLYNAVMLTIQEPDSQLPLLINETSFNIAGLVKSRLERRAMWQELRPLMITHNYHPICKLRYAGKPVDMYLSPISLMSFILGLDLYKRPHGYLPANDGLIPHLNGGFYTGFYW